MRSAIIAAAAFAATALAVPYEKRDVVTNIDTELSYVTTYVTVTAGAKPTQEAEPNKQHYGHSPKKPSWWGKPRKHTTTTVAEPEPTTSQWSQPDPSPKPPKSPSPKPKPTTTGWSEPSSPPRSAPASAPTDYASKATLHHNIHRANHSAPDIAWDSNLEASARQVAASCVYEHNVDAMGGGYGQNIAAGVEADNITAIITNLFYNGEVGWYDGLYGQSSPSMSNFEHWGHFSQIVWKATTHVGCYTQDCSGQGLANVGSNVSPYFTVCNYKSPGNFAGQYQNVGSPLGHPTADWNYGL